MINFLKSLSKTILVLFKKITVKKVEKEKLSISPIIEDGFHLTLSLFPSPCKCHASVLPSSLKISFCENAYGRLTEEMILSKCYACGSALGMTKSLFNRFVSNRINDSWEEHLKRIKRARFRSRNFIPIERK